jgi:hypothetical protein
MNPAPLLAERVPEDKPKKRLVERVRDVMRLIFPARLPSARCPPGYSRPDKMRSSGLSGAGKWPSVMPARYVRQPDSQSHEGETTVGIGK